MLMDSFQPVIVDPFNYDRQKAYTQALTQCQHFLKENGLQAPGQWETSMPMRYSRVYGLYSSTGAGRICVNLAKTRTPVKTPGFQWSFTGYKSDLTAPGVISHETGHHTERMMQQRVGTAEAKAIATAWRNVVTREAPVSSYEPNLAEAFAEAIKLFILNPDFLRKGRPLRYKFLTQTLGLGTVHDLAWQEILRHAHPKLISAAKSWIG